MSATKETAEARALARGTSAKKEMLRDLGGYLSSGEAAKLLGDSVSSINQRRTSKQLLAVPLAEGDWGYPMRQFASGNIRSGIPEIVSASGNMNPWVLISILLDRIPGLATQLIDLLDDPEVLQDVLTRVRSYGHHGAS